MTVEDLATESAALVAAVDLWTWSVCGIGDEGRAVRRAASFGGGNSTAAPLCSPFTSELTASTAHSFYEGSGGVMQQLL